ncbi:GNAT family protein [Paenibacillus sp. DMB5]|uniref:GNAT family N-acetyltransferase n=1 Tax=Paenibacillus sp. DMB5 TaxID=1780103 RepID=UPI00076D5907|nr:GNAT family protein [Paenibacillus sp. DMB5]KUP24545.1 acetyltransferase [Paenibacillus sp. DMB5]
MTDSNSLRYELRQMEEYDAREISGWKYEPPYDLYNMGDDPAGLQELLDGSYYAVTIPGNQLAGFFCYGGNARVPGGAEQGLYKGDNVLDIGLGMKPEYTGAGQGMDFLRAGISFAEQQYAPGKLRLTVAAFNLRAAALYRKAGFELTGSFERTGGDNSMEFLVMERPLL